MTHLLDIITPDELQRLQKTLIKTTRLRSAMCDLAGNSTGSADMYSPFCTMMRNNPATLPACRAAGAVLDKQARKTRKIVINTCSNLGIISARAPIIIEGQHLANWRLGEVVRKRLPEADVRQFARKNGLPEEETLAAYNAVPHLSNAELRRTFALFGVFAETLSEKAYKNHLLRKANADKTMALSMLNVVMDNVESVIYVNDPKTYRLAYASSYIHKLTGVDKLEGRICYEVFHDRDAPCPYCPHLKLFDAKGNPTGAVVHSEFHNEHLGRDFLITDRVITWHDGQPMHMEVAADVTERNALAAANIGNEARREFLARMSHELRTPMNGVLGMTHLALAANPPAEQREYLKKIQASASLLLGIINDILDFSRIEAGKMTLEHQPFNLRETFATAAQLIQPTANAKGISLAIAVSPEVPEFAVGDSVRIMQVLLNLLGNAVKFTTVGEVSFAAHSQESPQGKLRLECSVRDSGIGIAPEQIDGLFTPFAQADPSVARRFGGTGLGLSITRMLVELMGGKISVTSEQGVGSTFSFHLELEPLSGKQPEDVRLSPCLPVHGFKGKKILVVEDNAINQEIITALLQGMEISVDLAEDGEQGAAAFMRKDYDLIFMDIRMPVMDGFEATRRIRESGKHDATKVTIIAMTANAMTEDKKACFSAGMDGHISKPIIIEELNAVLARYLPSREERLTA